MLRMIWLQFKYSQKVWAASLFLFIVTGFLTGVCLNGIFTIADHYAHLQSAANLSALFYYPMIFGIITLFIVSNGVIKLVINSMRKDYTLWTILGANPNQLSLLIGGQLLIIGAIAAFIGFIIAVPFTVALSGWLSSLLGASQTANMPKLPFEFSVPACLWTISFISLTSGLAGYFHSHKLFINSQSNDLNFKKHHSKFQKIGRISLTVISAMGLLFCYGDSIILTPQARHYLINGSPHEAAKTYIPNLMLIMLFSIMLFSLLSPILLSWLIKLWTHLLPRKKSATTNTAFWHTLFDKNYLSSLIVPLFGGSFLLTGVNGVTSNITNGGGNQAAAANSLVSLVTFLGAPLLIILTNVFVITAIVSRQQKISLKQLLVLGFTSANAIAEHITEAFIYAITFLICAVIGNLPLYLTINQIGINTHDPMEISWNSVIAWPTWLFGLMLIFIAAVGSLNVVLVNREFSPAQ